VAVEIFFFISQRFSRELACRCGCCSATDLEFIEGIGVREALGDRNVSAKQKDCMMAMQMSGAKTTQRIVNRRANLDEQLRPRFTGVRRIRVGLQCFAIIAAALALVVMNVSTLRAQGSRRDDIVFGPSGYPISGATVAVCQATATGTSCTPLATRYTDATLTVTSPNLFHADGIGNYHSYAPV
jgi:hypothetical protein